MDDQLLEVLPAALWEVSLTPTGGLEYSLDAGTYSDPTLPYFGRPLTTKMTFTVEGGKLSAGTVWLRPDDATATLVPVQD